MGAYTCEFGVVHKRCRCREAHTIVCDVPLEHGIPEIPMENHPPIHNCIVLDMKIRSKTLGAHEAHPEHYWWYTSKSGGHQLEENFSPSHSNYDTYEGAVKQWLCPGRND